MSLLDALRNAGKSFVTPSSNAATDDDASPSGWQDGMRRPIGSAQARLASSEEASSWQRGTSASSSSKPGSPGGRPGIVPVRPPRSVEDTLRVLHKQVLRTAPAGGGPAGGSSGRDGSGGPRRAGGSGVAAALDIRQRSAPELLGTLAALGDLLVTRFPARFPRIDAALGAAVRAWEEDKETEAVRAAQEAVQQEQVASRPKRNPRVDTGRRKKMGSARAAHAAAAAALAQLSPDAPVEVQPPLPLPPAPPPPPAPVAPPLLSPSPPPPDTKPAPDPAPDPAPAPESAPVPMPESAPKPVPASDPAPLVLASEPGGTKLKLKWGVPAPKLMEVEELPPPPLPLRPILRRFSSLAGLRPDETAFSEAEPGPGSFRRSFTLERKLSGVSIQGPESSGPLGPSDEEPGRPPVGPRRVSFRVTDGEPPLLPTDEPPALRVLERGPSALRLKARLEEAAGATVLKMPVIDEPASGFLRRSVLDTVRRVSVVKAMGISPTGPAPWEDGATLPEAESSSISPTGTLPASRRGSTLRMGPIPAGPSAAATGSGSGSAGGEVSPGGSGAGLRQQRSSSARDMAAELTARLTKGDLMAPRGSTPPQGRSPLRTPSVTTPLSVTPPTGTPPPEPADPVNPPPPLLAAPPVSTARPPRPPRSPEPPSAEPSVGEAGGTKRPPRSIMWGPDNGGPSANNSGTGGGGGSGGVPPRVRSALRASSLASSPSSGSPTASPQRSAREVASSPQRSTSAPTRRSAPTSPRSGSEHGGSEHGGGSAPATPRAGTTMRDWREVLGKTSARPWRLDKEKDTVFINWQKERERQLRHIWNFKHNKIQEDLDFLSNIAVRMRRRNKRLEAEEAKSNQESVSRLQAASAHFKTRHANPFRQRPRTKQGHESLVNKYIAWCAMEMPPMPSLPTLPVVIIKYACTLHEEQKLVNINDLNSHFNAINVLHREAEFDLPCVEPTVHAAFMQAIKRVGEMAYRPPPERRSPVHPRFVVKMIDLATSTSDPVVRRCCVFTVLSYACMCRRALNQTVFLCDMLVERDGTVRVYERDPTNPYQAAAQATAQTKAIVFPHKIYRRPMRPNGEAGFKSAAGFGSGPSAGVSSDRSGGGTSSEEEVSRLSIKEMMIKFLATQRAAGVQDRDPAFWLPATDLRKPESHDNLSSAWVRQALDAVLAYPPAGEKWNGSSLRSGAVTAAFAVGVGLYECMLLGGFQAMPRKEAEKMPDVNQEPSYAGDFFFGHMRREGRALTEQQLELLVDEPTLGKKKLGPLASLPMPLMGTAPGTPRG